MLKVLNICNYIDSWFLSDVVPRSHVDARKAIKFKPGVKPSKVKSPVKNQIQTQVKTAVEIGFNFKLTRLFARVIRRMFLDNI